MSIFSNPARLQFSAVATRSFKPIFDLWYSLMYILNKEYEWVWAKYWFEDLIFLKLVYNFSWSLLHRFLLQIGDSTQTPPTQTTSIPVEQIASLRLKPDNTLTRISEHPSPEDSRRRSLTERPSLPIITARRKSQSEASDNGVQTRITKSRSAQDLQPPIFETNKNIQQQYSNTRSGGDPNATATLGRHRNQGNFRSRNSQPELYRSQNTPISPPHSVMHAPVTYGVYYPINPAHLHPLRGAPPRYGMENADYSDISLDIIPSLNEYSSRSSVCESSSAHSKKEVRST